MNVKSKKKKTFALRKRRKIAKKEEQMKVNVGLAEMEDAQNEVATKGTSARSKSEPSCN